MTTQPMPTIAGRQVRVAPRGALAPALPRPHLGRRHHWVTVAARRIAAAEDHTQLLQACSRGCGRHRIRVIPGHWQARDLVHPAAQL